MFIYIIKTNTYEIYITKERETFNNIKKIIHIVNGHLVKQLLIDTFSIEFTQLEENKFYCDDYDKILEVINRIVPNKYNLVTK